MKNAVLSFPVEIRSVQNGDEKRKKITGMAAVFNKLSDDLGGFREKIAPGAFTKTLRESPVIKAFWNHNSDRVLGSTKAGTLTLEERKDGLAFEIDPPEWASEHVETIDRGDVDQMSFQFRTIKDTWENNRETGEVIRTLIEVQLFEVSPVATPAYPQTDAKVRSLETSKLNRLIVQADHDLLNDNGRTELRQMLTDIQKRIDDSNHSEEPEPDNHSEEPGDGNRAGEVCSKDFENRMQLLAAVIGGE